MIQREYEVRHLVLFIDLWLHPNLRLTTRECLYLVTRSNFRSRDKDGNHTIRSAIAKKPMLNTNFMPLYYIEQELLPIRVLHCGNRDFRSLLVLCDIDLDLSTFIYELDPYFLEIYRKYEDELPMSTLLKVIVWQTDRQTDRAEIIYHAASWVVNNVDDDDEDNNNNSNAGDLL